MSQPPHQPTDIIEMKSSKTDEGEIVYTPGNPEDPWRKQLRKWIGRILGIALGVAFFLLLIFFFVYVVIPILLIVVVVSILKGIFSK